MKWGVWCEVTGGTVTRRAWLRHADALAVYDKREEAEAEAKRLNQTVGSNPNRRAEFVYVARQMP